MFSEKKEQNQVWEGAGYVFAYFLFTTILFFILSLLKKLPANWNYFHIMGITLLISIAGMIARKVLK